MKIFCVLCPAMWCSGCMLFGNIAHDVSNKPEAWGGYQRGQVYVLQQPVRLAKLYARDTSFDLWANWELQAFPTTDSVRVIEASGTEVVGTLAAGTKMRAAKVLYNETWNYDEWIVVMEILDGLFANRRVRVEALSKGLWEPRWPDPRFLKPESESESGGVGRVKPGVPEPIGRP